MEGIFTNFGTPIGLSGHQISLRHRPVKRGGGDQFSCLGAQPSLKSTKRMFHMAFFWPQICIKSIFGCPLGELTTLPQIPSRMVRGHPSPRLLPLDAIGVQISAYAEYVVIGSHDNDFPGPTVALDGPASTEFKTAVWWRSVVSECLLVCINVQTIQRIAQFLCKREKS